MFAKAFEPIRDCHWYVSETPPTAVAVNAVVPPTHSKKPAGWAENERPGFTTAVAVFDIELAQALPTELTTSW